MLDIKKQVKTAKDFPEIMVFDYKPKKPRGEK